MKNKRGGKKTEKEHEKGKMWKIRRNEEEKENKAKQ